MRPQPHAALASAATHLIFLILLAVAPLKSQSTSANQTQQLVFAGLRSVAAHGQFNSIKFDSAGHLYLLLDERDGVRILKTDATATTILDQSLLGATGDIGTALALDASGNVYVTGTTTSNALDATPGAAIPSRTDATANSFLAKYDADLNLDFVTFTGGSRIAASALAVTPDAIFVTGSLFSATLPITASAFQQSPATGSTQNGFVERFSSDGTTLLYATYLTGTGGNTTPTAIAADSSDAAYIAGSTTASGYPSAAALVPTILSNPSGFLTKITPAGDAASFSTFIPGPGLSSIALDASGQSLFLSGSIALGQFPVETVAAPIARLPYQTLLKLPLDGSSVQDSILLAPGTQSFLAPDSTGAIWVDQTLPAALLPISTLSPFGDVLALHITVQQTIDQAARFGGLPNGNPSFASISAILTSIAIDPSGEPVIAGSVQPTASSSLLATATYDLPLNNALTSVLPSTVRSAELSAATCSGSLCAGSAAYLAKLDPANAAPSLAASVDDSPFIVLRNLGSAAANNLAITATEASFSTNCPVMLPAAAECNLLLSGGGDGPATLTISAANVTPQTIPVPAFTSPASTIVVSPGELDFGIQTSTSPPAIRSFTVTNLGSTTQTFSSSALAPTGTASPFSQASTDCAPAADPGYASLPPAATCKITLAFTASPDPTSDVYLRNYWQIGSRDILLTGYSQAASLSISAAEIDFGTQYPNFPHLPRYLHLSNASTFAVAHAPVSLPGSSPFTVVDACPSLIPAQSVCTLRLDYVPTAVPSEDSTILTLDRDGIGEDLTVLVTGQTLPTPGTPTLPNGSFTISPSSITLTAPAAVTTVSAELHTVTIANTGSSSILLTFSVTGDFVAQSTCPAALTPGQNCIISVNFAPSQPGERLGLLTVSSGPGFSPTYIPITGTGTAILPAENDTLNLGATLLNQPITVFYLVTHAFPSLTASATGPYTVTLIPNLGFGPGNPTNFAPSATTACPNCYLGIRFDPITAGAQPGTLTLFSDPAGNPYTLALTGVGLPASGLIVSPSAQTFGTVPLSSSSPVFLFTLTNLSLSGQPIILTSPLLNGDFVLRDLPAGGQTCMGALAYSASCFLNLSFIPTAIGTRTGSLSFPTSDGTASATLTGFATADGGLSFNPTALVFSNVPGLTSTQQSITLTNTGTANLQIAAPTPATTAFLATTNCATLPPGGSCTITVTFSPGQALVSDTLTVPVTSPIGDATYTIPITGAYTAFSAGLEITPAQAAFGPTDIGTLGQPRQYTVQNLTAQTLTLSLAMPRQFTLIDPPCFNLAAAASCTFTAQFVPLTTADTTGSIVVHGTPADGSGPIQTITYLDGYGISLAAPVTLTGPIQSGIVSFGQVTSGQTGSAIITLTNRNTTPITIRRVTSAPPFLSTTNCGHVLATGQSCIVTINYAPTNQVPTGTPSPPSTADIGLLTIESDASSSPDLINLTGQGGPVASPTPSSNASIATYSLSQGSLTFALTPVGVASAPQSVTLLNTGTIPLHLLATSTTSDFAVLTTCSTVLPAATCTFTITSTPQSPGTHIAALEIATDSTASLEFVSLLASATTGSLAVSPASLDFGSVPVGASVTLPVQVTNTGSGPVFFASTTTSGNYAPSGTCPAPGASLPAAATCTIQVTFTPTDIGVSNGVLSLASNALVTPFTVALTGSGVQPQLVVSPSSLNFGNVGLGASATLTLKLANSGSAPITGINLSASGDYALTRPCLATLAPAASCTAQMTFTPTVPGVRNGALNITSSDPSSPLTVPLTGVGIQGGGPENVSFTLTVNGEPSATATVPIRSPGVFHLAVIPSNDYNGNVTLTCVAVIAGPFANCSVAPPSLAIAGATQPSIATITTLKTLSARSGFSARTLACILLPGALLLLAGQHRRLATGLLLGLFVVSGCGSGGNSNALYTPPGTYQYRVTASSTSGPAITRTVALTLIVQ